MVCEIRIVFFLDASFDRSFCIKIVMDIKWGPFHWRRKVKLGMNI